MNAKFLIAALFSVLLSAGATQAQYGQQSSSSTAAYASPGAQTSLGYGSYNYGAGFYESSVLEGAGSYAAGAGSYNLNTAQAADVWESARAKYILNYKTAIDTRYAIKRVNDEYRAEKYARERMTPELLSRVIQAKLPDRLTVAEYEPHSGRLAWPDVLRQPEFAAERRALEVAFAQRRPEDVGSASVFYKDVKELCERMHGTMLAQQDDLTAPERIAARNFLSSLQYEARHLPGELPLAMMTR